MTTDQEMDAEIEGKAKTPDQPPRPSQSDVRGAAHPGFARRHPIMTVLGAASLGLFGGIEMAAGVLLGAGVYAALRVRQGRGTVTREIPQEPEDVEQRTRGILDRASPELVSRAKAVVQAARGKIGPTQT